MSGIIKDKPVHISYRTYLSNRKLKSKKTNKISRLDKQQIDSGERVIRRIVDLIKIEEVEEIYGEVLLALFGTKDLMKLQSKLGILLISAVSLASSTDSLFSSTLTTFLQMSEIQIPNDVIPA